MKFPGAAGGDGIVAEFRLKKYFGINSLVIPASVLYHSMLNLSEPVRSKYAIANG